jgi:hypothetical protein
MLRFVNTLIIFIIPIETSQFKTPKQTFRTALSSMVKNQFAKLTIKHDQFHHSGNKYC